VRVIEEDLRSAHPALNVVASLFCEAHAPVRLPTDLADAADEGFSFAGGRDRETVPADFRLEVCQESPYARVRVISETLV